jgi:hypothetical protein
MLFSGEPLLQRRDQTGFRTKRFLFNPANNVRRAVAERDIPLSGAEKKEHRRSIHEGHVCKV